MVIYLCKNLPPYILWTVGPRNLDNSDSMKNKGIAQKSNDKVEKLLFGLCPGTLGNCCSLHFIHSISYYDYSLLSLLIIVSLCNTAGWCDSFSACHQQLLASFCLLNCQFE